MYKLEKMDEKHPQPLLLPSNLKRGTKKDE